MDLFPEKRRISAVNSKSAPQIDNHGKVIPPHDPELYRPGSQAKPIPNLEAFSPADADFYKSHGYLAVAEAFSPTEVNSAIAGFTDLCLGRVPGFDGVLFEAAAGSRIDDLAGDARLDAVRKLFRFVEHEPRTRALAEHPGLLQVVSILLGGQKPELYADQALSKPPRIGREKPWHQDLAFFDFDPLQVPVVGVWIALDPVGIDNGCMQLLPGRHREGPIPHFQRRDFQICDTDILGSRSVAVPLEPGGLLFFDGLLPHGTPHNKSPRRRRALQFHYVPTGSPRAKREVRLGHFGGEDTGAQC